MIDFLTLMDVYNEEVKSSRTSYHVELENCFIESLNVEYYSVINPHG